MTLSRYFNMSHLDLALVGYRRDSAQSIIILLGYRNQKTFRYDKAGKTSITIMTTMCIVTVSNNPRNR